VRCPVCSGEESSEICDRDEVRAHLEYLRWFHRRRLRLPRDEELAERAGFTQDYATNIVACDSCGLVFRNPRPRAEAVTRAYAQDRYGFRRLAELFEPQLELYRAKAR